MMAAPTPAQITLLATLAERGRPITRRSSGWKVGYQDGPRWSRATVDRCVRDRYIVAIDPSASAPEYVLAPDGREALKAARPDALAFWDGEALVRLREHVRGRSYQGPIEVSECGEHEGEWTLYRWTWRLDSDDDMGDEAPHLAALQDGEPDQVRGCTRCAEEQEAAIAAEMEDDR